MMKLIDVLLCEDCVYFMYLLMYVYDYEIGVLLGKIVCGGEGICIEDY